MKAVNLTDRGVGNAAYYAAYYATQTPEDYAWILADIVKHAGPGPILDLGAGLGFFVELATSRGWTCQGLEGSADAVAQARLRAPDLAIIHHVLSQALPFDDHSFQSVLINQVIEHLEPSVASNAILEASRVLRPGGMLLIFSPSCYNQRERDADPTHINMLSPSALQRLVISAGFQRYAALNRPLAIFGESRLGLGLVSRLFRWRPFDRLSSTANCRAYKPADPSAFGSATGDA